MCLICEDAAFDELFLLTLEIDEDDSRCYDGTVFSTDQHGELVVGEDG